MPADDAPSQPSTGAIAAAARSASAPPCAACHRRDPARKLAFEIALGAAEVVEADLDRWHEVQIGERINERLADAPVEFRPVGEFGRDVVADHKTASPLLNDKHRADDAFVLA